MSEPTRVVLVKPGDVLIIGGLTLTPEASVPFAAAIAELKAALGLTGILVCEDDVSIAAEMQPRSTDHDHTRCADLSDDQWAVRHGCP